MKTLIIYASKHGIIDGLTIQFESDGSGVAFKYFDKCVSNFNRTVRPFLLFYRLRRLKHAHPKPKTSC